MAESKTQTEKAAPDPTIGSKELAAASYPEGTHPPAPPSKQEFSPDRFTYKDHPDKPDPTTVAQIVEDPAS